MFEPPRLAFLFGLNTRGIFPKAPQDLPRFDKSGMRTRATTTHIRPEKQPGGYSTVTLSVRAVFHCKIYQND